MRIMLDGGHGYYTSGKRTVDGTMREWEFNSSVALLVANELAKYEGVITQFSHDTTGKTDISLDARTDKANAWGADLLVSIHANGYSTGWNSAHGIETFVYKTSLKGSYNVASKVQAALIAATGLSNRGVKAGNLHMVRESNMDAILVECGFMTNQAEAALLKTAAYRNKCATAIVKGIVQAYGLKAKPVVAPKPAPKPTPTPAPAKPKYVLPTGILRRGNTGGNVRLLQTALKAANFDPKGIDGSFGAGTENALRRFQSMYYGLTVDGIYGTASRNKLNEVLN